MVVYRELSSLQQDLGFSARTLYAVSNSLIRHYRPVQLPKKGGGFRSLSVPDEILKSIQRRIADVLLPLMPVSPYARAYRDCASTLKNARPHVAKEVVLTLDILHFFDSVRYSQVKELVFPADMYAEPIRILLSMLCYHGDGLPQGAPTSPAITNIIFCRFDELVGAWCRERGIAYTRYCDDLTFSGSFDPREVIGFIRRELKQRGFLLNEQKTRIQRRGRQQCVTGIVVNEKPSIPLPYRRRLRQELHFCRKFGAADHMARAGIQLTEEQYLHQLLGRVNYVLHVHPEDHDLHEAGVWLKNRINDLK